MTSSNLILSSVDGRGIATIKINRAEIHNAFDDLLIAEMVSAFDAVASNDDVRIVVLASEGKSFSAGANLNWMRRMADYTNAENLEDARGLANLLKVIATCPKPTIARVQGAALGGGVGLVATCDIAIGASSAVFGLTEVRLGVIAGTISPYVLRAIGERQTSRYMISGERFDATEAQRIGLLHKVVDLENLDDALKETVGELLKNSPSAMVQSKALIAAVANRPIDDAVIEETAQRIADARASDDGREGLDAFLNKRKPSWIAQ